MKRKTFYQGLVLVFWLSAIDAGAQSPMPAHAGGIFGGAGAPLMDDPNSVFVSGNYAYVASSSSNALEIINISNPAAPAHTGSIVNGMGGANMLNPRSVFVVGNYAYVACAASHTLEIIDVSNPSAPVHASYLLHTTNGALLFAPQSVYVSGNYAYVASPTGGVNGSLEVVNVSNPLSPVHAGSLANGAGGALLEGANSVHVSGNYAFVTSASGNFLEIINISDPSNPVHVSTLQHGGGGGAALMRPSSIFVSGNYAYVASADSDALEIINISNPSLPVHAGVLINGTDGAKLNEPTYVTVSGNYAYVTSNVSLALEVVDISNPSAPTHAASLTSGTGGALLSGLTSIRVSGNYAYVTNTDVNALEVVNVTNPLLPVHAGSLINATAGALLTNPSSVFVSGNYAYVASAASNALEVVNISSPSSPVHAASLSDGEGGAQLSNPRSVFVSGSYAYVASAGSSALEIVNITNPLAPVHAGSITHGTGGALLQNCASVYVSGNYAYVAATDNNALEIVNVTDRAAPVHQGSLNGLTSTNSVFVSGSYAYLTTSNALKIVTISDPSTPVLAGSITNGTALLDLPYSVFISGNYAYVASVFSSALEVIDISTPSAPTHAGSLVHGTGGAKLNHPVSVFVSGNYAYVVSNAGKSLEVVNIANPASPSHFANLLDGVGGASLYQPTSVFVSGGYAYVTNYGEGLEVVSLFQPLTPVAVAASSITVNSFTANWNAVGNAEAYLLDVSPDNFSTFIDGFENTEVLLVTSFQFLSLNRGTTYSYRVQAKNINGTTGSSNVISVTTIPDTPVTTAATSVSETGLTINWTAVTGASIYYIDVSLDGFDNMIDGYDNRSSTTNSIVMTGLSASNLYYYRVRAANSSGTSPSSITAYEATGPGEPSVAGPITFTGFTTTSLSAEFPGAAGTTGHLILQRAGASPTGTPIDGTTYAAGNIIGDSEVVAVGTNTFTVSGLTPNTVYYYDVIAYNGSGTLTNYNETDRSEGSRTTLQTAPTTVPTLPVFSNGTINELDISFTPAAGVDGYIVVVGRDPGSFSDDSPEDGFQYSVDQLIPGYHAGYVRHVGNGSSFTVISLTPGLPYCFSFYSYNGAGDAVNYYGTTNACSYALATEPSAPTNLTFSSSVNSITGSFNVSGPFNLVLQKTGSSPTGSPVDGVVYSVNDVIGDATVISVEGLPNSFSSASLNANTVYYYDVIAYNGMEEGINYNSSTPLEGSYSTLQTEPLNQPTDVIFSNIMSESLDCSFTPTAVTPTGYLVLRRRDDVPTGVPVDGTTYSVGLPIGDALVVYAGSSPMISDIFSLQAGRLYTYKIFAYNGAGTTINYLTDSPAQSTVTMVPPAPSIKSPGDLEQTSFTANWNGATGADSYVLDVSTDNFVTLLSGYDSKPVSGTSASVTGLVGGTIYQHRLRAVNTSGVSENSGTETALTKPPTPVGSPATSIGLSSFTANWNVVPTAIEYFLDVATDVSFTSILVGYNNITVTGTSQSVTGLIPNTGYYYRVRASNNSGLSPNSIPVATSTLTSEPVAQATAILLTEPTSSSINLSFSEALGNPTGYIILMKAGSSPTDVPVDGQKYSGETTLGSSQIVFNGSFNSLNVLDLSANTNYYFTIFAFNGSGTSTNYLITNPLSGNRFTLVPEPTAQPTFIDFDHVTVNSMDVGFNAAPGADGYVVFRYETSGGIHPAGPSDGVAYTQGSVASDGAIVSVGAGTSFSQSGLSENHVYSFAVYSFTGSGQTINYLTVAPLSGDRSTLMSEPTSAPSSLTFSGLTPTSLTGTFISSSAEGYLVLQTLGSSSTGVPVDGTVYAVDDVVGNGKVVGAGPATTFTATDLSSNSLYFYDVIAYNGSGNTTNYYSASRLEDSRTTLQLEPLSQATDIVFNNITTSTLDGSFIAASGSPSGYLVLSKLGSSPTGIPADGAMYIADDVIGDSKVVSVSATTAFADAALVAGTVYHYAIFSFNGSGAAINYLETSPAATSVITISPAPSATTASNKTSSSLTANWNLATGATGYELDVSLNNFSTFVNGYEAKLVSNTNDDVTGLDAGTIYQYRVRAVNASGVSVNSNTINQITVPPTPIAAAATAVGLSGFTANWQAATSATGYFLDVATDSNFNFIQIDNQAVTGISRNVTGLSPNAAYYYRVRAVNAAGVTPSSTTIEVSTLIAEPVAQPTAISFSNPTSSGLTISFTAAVGNPSGYLALMKEGTSPTDIPFDGVDYVVGNFLGSSKIVFSGSGTLFNVTGLLPNTVYHVAIFAYNGVTSSWNYLVSNPLSGSRVTLEVEPISQPTAIILNNITTSSLEGSLTAASGNPSGYLVLRKLGSIPTAIPLDGITYATDESIGDGEVVSVSGTTEFSDAGLVAGTVYHYATFSFNGGGDAINYLTVIPATSSVITISAAPLSIAADPVASDSFTAKWNSVTGATGYELDVSMDNFGTTISGYSAAAVSGTSDNVTGLVAGTTYQYRVRAVNASGVSDNSNTTSQITVPAIPTAIAAATVRTNDFMAKWTDVQGETSYELDVSTNDFSSFTGVYHQLSLAANATSEPVTGLSSSTEYHYRVRAVNAGGHSEYSETITAITTAAPGNNALDVGTPTFPPTSDGSADIAVDVSIAGDAPGKVAMIHYRGATAATLTDMPMANPTGNTFHFSIPSSALDDIGIEFFVTATNVLAEHDESASNFVYRSFTANQAPRISSILRFGGKVETYQIISIPFKLDDDLISSIFEPALGEYDKTKWRLVRYQLGKNTDYRGGLTRINLGESYWFNSVSEVEVKLPGSGVAAPYNQSKPFVLKLAQGWNQIATPFPFAIDWDDILELNGNPAGVGPYREFDPGIINFKSSNHLIPFSGGFVHTDAAIDLNLPVTLKSTAGDRIASTGVGTDIGEDNWILPITLQQGRVTNPLGGIGMHSLAKPGKDDFDDITLPRFVNHLEFNSYHNDFFEPRFSRDVVPSSGQHSWEISIESDFDEGPITLNWSDSDLGNNGAQLLLLDPVGDVLVDMKKIRSYTVGSASGQALKLIYFRETRIDIGDMVYLNRPYPNPSPMKVDFDLFSDIDADFQLEVFDLFGKKVHSMDHSMKGVVSKTIEWPGNDRAGQKVPSGLYVYKLTSHSNGGSKVSQGRIIIH